MEKANEVNVCYIESFSDGRELKRRCLERIEKELRISKGFSGIPLGRVIISEVMH